MGKADRSLHREGRFRSIATSVQQLIADHCILPGDRLPAERKLAEALQVSRTSVREALRILEQQDLVEIRLGRNGGAYVKSPALESLAEGMENLLRIDRLSLDQIAEFREAIECAAAATAARKADSADVRLLRHLLESARSVIGKVQGGVDEFIEADKAVHLCIARISDNPLLAQALAASLGLKRYFCRFHGLPPTFMDANLSDLNGIVQAIEDRQPDIACNKTRSHIAVFNQTVS